METKSITAIQNYLNKQGSEFLTSDIPLTNNLHISIVIPCFNEPDVLQTLESICLCRGFTCGVEVILLINTFVDTPAAIAALNEKTYTSALAFAQENNRQDFSIIPLHIKNLPSKFAGVGLPRKIGMDEALRRFVRLGKGEGLLVCLDADCMVQENYIAEIEHQFKTDKKCVALSIQFHHLVEHLEENDPLRRAAIQYEIYLRYYQMALAYIGYPYPFYTIGSAIAVRAIVYAKVGGMGKQAAGEDFYFMQKIFPAGKVIFLSATCVFPAARYSNRVLFGTGPALKELSATNEIVKKTYCLESFAMLKILFADVCKFFVSEKDQIQSTINAYPKALQEFLSNDSFLVNLWEIRSNTSDLASFTKRFFRYFNALKIIQFLNFSHSPSPSQYFQLSAVCQECHKLLNLHREEDKLFLSDYDLYEFLYDNITI